MFGGPCERTGVVDHVLTQKLDSVRYMRRAHDRPFLIEAVESQPEQLESRLRGSSRRHDCLPADNLTQKSTVRNAFRHRFGADCARLRASTPAPGCRLPNVGFSRIAWLTPEAESCMAMLGLSIGIASKSFVSKISIINKFSDNV